MAKKKEYNLVRKIVTELRKIHRGWPQANQCLRNAKTEKGYCCAYCGKYFRKEYMRKDHIIPIGKEPVAEQKLTAVNCPRLYVWVPSWDYYVNTLFSPLENYQALCLDCHDAKTKKEKENARNTKRSQKANAKKQKDQAIGEASKGDAQKQKEGRTTS